MRAIATLGRLVAAVVKALALLALLGGVPAGLLTQIPWPSLAQTRRILEDPVSTVEHALTGGLSDTTAIVALAIALWILWAAFTLSVVVELASAIRGVPVPHYRLLAPTQTLAGWLLAGVLAASPIAAPLTHTAPSVVATTSVHTDAPRPDAAVRPAVPAALAVPAARSTAVTTVVSGPRSPAAQPMYEVARGDWLGMISERFLGDFDRYPEIRRLNPDLIPHDTGPHGPDHIEPTWQLRLPADAQDRGPRRHATGHLMVTSPPASTPPGGATNHCPAPDPGTPPAATPAPSGSPSPPPTADPTPSAVPSIPARDPDGVVADPSHRPSTSPSAPATSNVPTSPSTDPPAGPSPGQGVGVTLPGGWVSIPLAAALVAAAAMVWLRRRHRYVPQPLAARTTDDADLAPLPPVVTRLRRAVREQTPELLRPPVPRQPTVAEYADSNDDRPALPPIGPSGLDLAGLADQVPAGGLGLVGPGAEPAARALLVATLSAGGPDDPDARGQVIIPADALTTLLGAQAVNVGPMPRLTVTATLPEALTRVEELLIERRRLLQDYDANDLAGMRQADPYHPPMPPVLLLAETPPAELRARLTTTLHLGTPLQISAVLLGEWPRGDTVTVRTDGHTGTDTERLSVLDVPTTLQLLQVLREAHTGETTSNAPVETAPVDDPAAPPVDEHPAEPAATPTETADSTTARAASPRDDAATPAGATPPAETGADDGTTPATRRGPTSAAGEDVDADLPAAPPRRPRRRPVRIRLLGTPAILNRDGAEVNGLRHHARELLVYLAVHRNGADFSDIMEAFWPTATVPRARERLSTEAGDLRRRIRQAAGEKELQPVVNTGSRYHLDPNLVDLDVWTLTDALRQAGAATDPAARIAALHAAVHAHTGTLADGYDYDWIEQPREQLRRHGIRARLHLADLTAGTNPRQAADLTQAAAALDPYNEDLARQAMRALARVGDAAAIRAQLQRLRTALDDIEEEPSGETIALAAQLHREITDAGRRRDRDQPDDPPPANDP